MSLPLPKETIKKKRPYFGHKSFLQLETTHDDISIPTRVCIYIYELDDLCRYMYEPSWFQLWHIVLTGLSLHSSHFETRAMADMKMFGLAYAKSSLCCRHARGSINATKC